MICQIDQTFSPPNFPAIQYSTNQPQVKCMQCVYVKVMHATWMYYCKLHTRPHRCIHYSKDMQLNNIMLVIECVQVTSQMWSSTKTCMAWNTTHMWKILYISEILFTCMVVKPCVYTYFMKLQTRTHEWSKTQLKSFTSS